MNKEKIEKEYKKKIKLINNYNKNYYDASKPLVTDEVYDDLKESILSFTSFQSSLSGSLK